MTTYKLLALSAAAVRSRNEGKALSVEGLSARGSMMDGHNGKRDQLDNLGTILRQTFGKSKDGDWASFRADYAEILMKLDEPGRKR